MPIVNPNAVANVFSARFLWHLYRAAVWRDVVEDHSSELLSYGDRLTLNYADAITDAASRSTGLRARDYDVDNTGGTLDAIEYERVATEAVVLIIDKAKYVGWEVDDIDARQVRPSLINAQARREANIAALQISDDIRAEFDAATIPALIGNVVPAGAAYVNIITPETALAATVAERILEASVTCDTLYWPKEGRYMMINPYIKGLLIKYLLDKNLFTMPSLQNPAYADAMIGMTFGFAPYIDPGIPTTGTEAHSIYFGIKGDGLAFAQQINKMEHLRSVDRVSDLMRTLYVYGAKKVDAAKVRKIRFNTN